MLQQIKNIAEGWKNVVIPDDVVEKVAAERLLICKQCDYFSENAKRISGYKTVRPDEHCTDCGCPLISKTRAMGAKCPKNKWLPHGDPEKS